MLASLFAPFSGLWQLPVRLIVGLIFAMHGWQKYDGGVEKFQGLLTSQGIPMPEVFSWVVIGAELIGGICLILGLFTRYAATLLSIVMLVVILKMKLGAGLVGRGGYELEASLLAGCLALLMAGPGVASLEKMFFKKEL